MKRDKDKYKKALSALSKENKRHGEKTLQLAKAEAKAAKSGKISKMKM